MEYVKEIGRKNWRILIQFHLSPKDWGLDLYLGKKFPWTGFTFGPLSIAYTSRRIIDKMIERNS